MKRLNIFIFALLAWSALACSRYDYYPRGIHQDEKSDEVVKNAAVYIVKDNDSLYSIGKRYNVDYHLLAKRNGIKRPYTIYVGQRVYIHGKIAPVKNEAAIKYKPTKAPLLPLAGQGKVKLIWPTVGRLSSRFGPRKKRMHDGIDIAAKEGTPVIAAAPGVVVYADAKLTGYGNLIIVRHTSDMFTAYAHNQKNLVKRGEKVAAGQKIAYVGSTGRASGAHLHFEVRRGETAVDPLAYLPKR